MGVAEREIGPTRRRGTTPLRLRIRRLGVRIPSGALAKAQVISPVDLGFRASRVGLVAPSAGALPAIRQVLLHFKLPIDCGWDFALPAKENLGLAKDHRPKWRDDRVRTITNF